MIRNVLLDLDDTIFDFKACERLALSVALRSFGIAFLPEDLSDYSLINDGMWKRFEKGEITRGELMIKRFEIFLARYDASVSPTEFADGYMQALSKTDVLIDGAEDVLRILSEKYDLYAVTNGYERTQMGRIRRSGIDRYFKEIFISERVGAVKPNKDFFDYCAQQIPDFSIEETVLIGDSPTSDIRGGNAYGLYTIRYNPASLPNPSDAIPDREIRSLTELPTLLCQLSARKGS